VFSLDVRTVIIITLSIAAFSAVGLFAFGRTQQRFKGFGCLSAGSAMFAVGGGLLGLRDVWPDLITIVVANAVVVLGTVLIYEGTRRFLKGSLRPRAISIASVCASVAFCTYFTYFSPSVNGRIVVFAAISMTITFLAGWEILRHCRYRCNLAESATVLTFFLYSLFQLFRMAVSFREEAISSFMKAGPVHAIALAIVSVFLFGVMFGFVWMVSCRLIDELTELATYDALTNVLNRRGVEFLASRLFAERAREETELTTVLMDVDHFKDVNDCFGHGHGDQVLAGISRLIESTSRASDIVGRIGGDEFVILLPKTDVEHAMVFAERLRSVVAGAEFVVGEDRVRVTASFGISGHFPPDASLDRIMQPADKALYQSKQDGRNRVSRWTPPEG